MSRGSRFSSSSPEPSAVAAFYPSPSDERALVFRWAPFPDGSRGCTSSRATCHLCVPVNEMPLRVFRAFSNWIFLMFSFESSVYILETGHLVTVSFELCSSSSYLCFYSLNGTFKRQRFCVEVSYPVDEVTLNAYISENFHLE